MSLHSRLWTEYSYAATPTHGKIRVNHTYRSIRCTMISKIKYASYGVKLNCQNVILSHERRLRHLSPASLTGRNAAAGLANSWRRWTEVPFDWCLASFWAQCHQRVMKVWQILSFGLFGISEVFGSWTMKIQSLKQNFNSRLAEIQEAICENINAETFGKPFRSFQVIRRYLWLQHRIGVQWFSIRD